MKKNLFALLAVLMIISLVLSACGAKPTPEPQAPASQPTVAAAEPTQAPAPAAPGDVQAGDGQTEEDRLLRV